VIADEGDHLIQWRSWIFAYAVLWVVLVLVAVVLAAAVYGENGAFAVRFVRMSVAWAFMLVYALMARLNHVSNSGTLNEEGSRHDWPVDKRSTKIPFRRPSISPHDGRRHLSRSEGR
jgi:hypothetical protein